jgi:hypothetical protein
MLLKAGHRQFAAHPDSFGGAPREKNYCPPAGVLIATGNLILSPVQGHSWASWASPSQKIQAIAGFMLLGGGIAVAFYSPGRG